jgi:hypothetical protein
MQKKVVMIGAIAFRPPARRATEKEGSNTNKQINNHFRNYITINQKSKINAQQSTIIINNQQSTINNQQSQ